MIITALLAIMNAFISGLIAFLPDATALPTDFNDAWTWLSNMVASLLYVIPSGEIFLQILTYILAIEFAIFVWRSINWTINIIRGSGA